MSLTALLLRALLVLLIMAGVGYVLPSWMQFMLTMAMANGLVSLGIVLLMRGGVVAFGQGLMSAIGGYAAALLFLHWGVTDAVGLLGRLVRHAHYRTLCPLVGALPWHFLFHAVLGFFYGGLRLACENRVLGRL